VNAAQPNPPPLVVAASLAAVEGVLLVLYGVLEVVSLSSGRVTMGLTTGAFFALYGAFLALCARQLLRRESWARGFVAMAQLVQLGVAWSFRGDGTTWLAILLAVVALVTGAGLIHPASVDALADDPTR
jgi:uncharacterized membrane protein HdeD (DUF308 family)